MLLKTAAVVLLAITGCSSSSSTPIATDDGGIEAHADAGPGCVDDGDGPCCPTGRPTPEGCLIGQLEWHCTTSSPKTRALLGKRGCMSGGSMIFMCCPL